MAKRALPAPGEPPATKRAPRQVSNGQLPIDERLPLSTNMRNNFAANLQSARKAAGLSKAELARRVGITRRILIEVEAGRQNLTLETVERLAQAVGLNGCDLLCSPS